MKKNHKHCLEHLLSNSATSAFLPLISLQSGRKQLENYLRKVIDPIKGNSVKKISHVALNQFYEFFKAPVACINLSLISFQGQISVNAIV